MSDLYGWITDIEFRQKPALSWEVAYKNALDLTERLAREGYDVTLRPTLEDVPTGSVSPGWGEAAGDEAA